MSAREAGLAQVASLELRTAQLAILEPCLGQIVLTNVTSARMQRMKGSLRARSLTNEQ